MEPHLTTDKQRAGWDFASANPEEATLSGIARAAGVSTGTASKWLRQWRDELGEDLFRTERSQADAERTLQARQAAESGWAELRAAEARNVGVTASQVRARLLAILDTVGTSWVDRGPDGKAEPVVVNGPDARQVKALADATATLLASAERLGGHAHPDKTVPRPATNVGAQVNVDLSSLARKTKDSNVIELRDRLGALSESLARRKASLEVDYAEEA